MAQPNEPPFEIKDRHRLAEGSGEGAEPDPVSVPTPLSFTALILSFGTSALVHLGKEADPTTGQMAMNLRTAQETIDLLAILDEKTRGNLTQEEDTLLKNLLYSLRMTYVEVTRRQG